MFQYGQMQSRQGHAQVDNLRRVVEISIAHTEIDPLVRAHIETH